MLLFQYMYLENGTNGNRKIVFLGRQTINGFRKGTHLCLHMYIYIHIDAAVSNGKRKPRQIFLDLFTVCSLCKRKFVICPFVYEETNSS